MNENVASYDVMPVRKVFSKIGLALTVILIVGSVLQILAMLVPEMLWGSDHWLLTSSWGMWILTFVPLYLIAVPIGLLAFRCIPAKVPQENKLRTSDFIIFLLISFCLMYAGNIVGTVLSAVLSGGTAENALTNYAMDNNPLKIVFVVILAPLIEEYVFRKKLIDCTSVYGEKAAVLFSGLTFGLYHMNLFQFFYAFLLGVVFAYVYTRTGRLRYTVLMHAIINFMGTVVAPFVISFMDLDAITALQTMSETEMMAAMLDVLPGMLLYLVYIMVIFSMAIAGFILLILRWKAARWQEAVLELPEKQGRKARYLNVGMIIYTILCVAMMVVALFA